MSEEGIFPNERGLAERAARFETANPTVSHAALSPYLSGRPGFALHIGAGTAEDAAWLAGRGWEVFAVEPDPACRALAGRLHGSDRIRWFDDRLPNLDAIRRLGLLFDLVWLGFFWNRVAPEHQRTAFRRLATLLRPGGRFFLGLPYVPADSPRTVPLGAIEEIERLASEHGLVVRAVLEQSDGFGRSDRRWKFVVLELPDDGTEALPILRSIVLKDVKAATYKLALLRVLIRIADHSASLVTFEQDRVVVPLGLVALYWLRLFKPLVELDLPQAAGQRAGRGLGFVKHGFSCIRPIAPFELRPGATFRGAEAANLADALRDAAYTIARMPARFITDPEGAPVFPTQYSGKPCVQHELVLDRETLSSFGATRVPVHLWMTMRRLAVWIEPMIVAEWSQLMQKYAERQGRHVDGDLARNLLRWIDPERDTSLVRQIASGLLDSGRSIYCVWTGRRLGDLQAVEIDHCFPWSAWPCDDLWNLLPCSRSVNQQKRDRLITRELLYDAADRIQDWWERAYRKNEQIRFVARRFQLEARSTLPVEPDSLARQLCSDPGLWGSLAPFIDAMDLQRLRLRRDQQIPEWPGPVR